MAVTYLVWSILLAGMTGADSLIPAWLFDVVMETNPSPLRVGQVTVTLHITPQDTCDEMSVGVEMDHMICQEPLLVTAPVSLGVSTAFSWEVFIPPNDTCGLVFTMHHGEYRQKTAIYWVTVGDTIISYPWNPRSATLKKYDPDSITVPIKNTTRPQKATPRCRVTGSSRDPGGDSTRQSPDSSAKPERRIQQAEEP